MSYPISSAAALQGRFAAMESNLSEAQRRAIGLEAEREAIRQGIADANGANPPDFEAISKYCKRLGEIQLELARIAQ